MNNKKGNAKALIPLLVFVGIYLAAGIIYTLQGVDMAFYQFPIAASAFLGLCLAFAMTKGKMSEKFAIFQKGVANEDITIMLVIYMLAGAFSAIATAMGGKDSTINLGLSLIPVQFLAAGVFIIAAFMATATGTSMGTLSAIAPITIGIAQKGNLNVGLILGATIGGAMFGDNLSMISDTTIAATRSQGCEMRDKFKVNFLIALPSALITIVLLLIFGRPDTTEAIVPGSYEIIKVVPYILVLALALAGLDVLITLTVGIFSAALIGFITGSLTISGFATSLWGGITGMDETYYITFLVAGLTALIQANGGVDFILESVRKVMKDNKSGQIGIAALVSLVDIAVANNTIAIIVSGKVAKEIAGDYKIDPRRTASLLDVFACVWQGLIPYGAQVIVAAGFASAAGSPIGPFGVIPFIWYCFIVGIVGIISIFVPFADGVCRKDPWNWEYDCAESGVEAKKAALAAAEGTK